MLGTHKPGSLPGTVASRLARGVGCHTYLPLVLLFVATRLHHPTVAAEYSDEAQISLAPPSKGLDHRSDAASTKN